MKSLGLLIVFLFLMIAGTSSGQKDWQKLRNAADVCEMYPEQVKSLFQHLNLEMPGLAKVKEAYGRGDLVKASDLLLQYYAQSPSVAMFRLSHPKPSGNTSTEGEAILKDTYTFQLVEGTVPRKGDGHLDWSCTGPENDIEWAWALNRHYPVSSLITAYYETGSPAYIRYADRFIADWIISSRPYPGVRSSTAMWRGLEVSFRVKVWARIFFEFMDTDLISPATRLLILTSLPDHAHYARNFHAQNNWLTMEISGLATVAAYWPEFRESAGWLGYSTGTMVESMKDQIYPDGVQTELASSYHFVSLDNFNQYLEICKRAGIPLPAYYTNTISDMWQYLAFTMRPDGAGILNNDSDRNNNRSRVLRAAKEYDRADWEYVATNGASGVKPEMGPSFHYPWAGQLISRSGYDADAHWSFFDIGPWGSGHQHNDKLHLSVAAYGRDLLVDAGRFAYRGEVADKFRRYALGSHGHNLLLIDKKGQAPGPKLATEPVPAGDVKITNDHDYATGSFETFNGVEGAVKHTRTLYYLREKFWVVVDQVATDRPREIDALWHWHPSIEVDVDGQRVFTRNDRGNLQIIPAGKQNWRVSLVKGQETPDIQGWYSEQYNKVEPNYATIFSAKIDKTSTFVWVLYPSEGVVSGVKAEVLSENDREVKVKVTAPGRQEWVVEVPLPAGAGKAE